MKRNWFESIVAKTAAGLGAVLLTTCMACCPAGDETCCPADVEKGAPEAKVVPTPDPSEGPELTDPQAANTSAKGIRLTDFEAAKAKAEMEALKEEKVVPTPDPSEGPELTDPQVADLSAEGLWLTDFEAAKAKAKAENKKLYLFFTGSDWCGWCKKLHADTLDTPEFINWAEKNLVLVDIDFPSGSVPQTAALKGQNGNLKSTYGANGYPTAVVTDADGEELGRIVGYATDYTNRLETIIKAPSAEEPSPTEPEVKPAEEPSPTEPETPNAG